MSTSPHKQLSQQAATRLQSHQWREALSLLDQLVAFQPQSPAIAYNRALCHFHLGDNATAREELTDVLAVQPDFREAQSLLRAVEKSFNGGSPAPNAAPPSIPDGAVHAAEPGAQGSILNMIAVVCVVAIVLLVGAILAVTFLGDGNERVRVADDRDTRGEDASEEGPRDPSPATIDPRADEPPDEIPMTIEPAPLTALVKTETGQAVVFGFAGDPHPENNPFFTVNERANIAVLLSPEADVASIDFHALQTLVGNENSQPRERLEAALQLIRAGDTSDAPVDVLARFHKYTADDGIEGLRRLIAVGPRAVEPLLRHHKANDPKGNYTAWALGEIGGPQAIQALGQMARERGTSAHEPAIDALVHIGSSSWDEILALVTDGSQGDIRPAARALARVGDRQLAGQLIPLLEHTDWNIRVETARALGILGHVEAKGLLEEWVASSEADSPYPTYNRLCIAATLALQDFSDGAPGDHPMSELDAADDEAGFRAGPSRDGSRQASGVRHSPRVKWRFPAPRAAEFSPVFQDDVVLMAGCDNLNVHYYGIDANTGDRLWTRQFRVRQGKFMPLTAARGKLLVSGATDRLLALDAKTGDTVWESALEDRTTVPSPLNDTLYVGCGDRCVYGLDPASGGVTFTYSTGVDPATILWPTGNDPQTRQRRNDLKRTMGGAVGSSIASDGKTLYFNVMGKGLYAIEIGTREKTWESWTETCPWTAIVGDTLVQENGQVYDRRTGQRREFYELPVERMDTANCWALAGDKVVFTTECGYLAARDFRTQRDAWAHQFPHQSLAIPSVASGLVLIGTKQGVVYALEADTGTEQWRLDIGSPVAGAPLAKDGALYLTTDDQFLYAIEEGGLLPVAR